MAASCFRSWFRSVILRLTQARPAGAAPGAHAARSRRGAPPRVLGLAAVLLLGTAQAQYAHLDAALSDIVDAVATGHPDAPWVGTARLHRDDAQLDEAARAILVDVYVDASGTTSLSELQAQLEAMGALVIAVDPDYRQGALSAYVRFEQILSASMQPGLHTMSMAERPERRVGQATSQGTRVIESDTANGIGLRGRGLAVGVISDSYDRNLLALTDAAADIGSNDLKAPAEGAVREYVLTNGDWRDEGRAMMQIVHDVAPEADLCFASGWGTEIHLAAAIEWLRTGPCGADVIVDDLGYAGSPVYSDGPAARKVEKVVASTTLPGKPVVYVSAAGNDSGTARKGSIDLPQAQFLPLPPIVAAGINFATCVVTPEHGHSAADDRGGWLVFRHDAAGNPVFGEDVTVASDGLLVLQWDDPYRAKAMTADLNVYLLDAAGNCVVAFGTDNFTEDRAVEMIRLWLPGLAPGGGPFDGRIMVARTGVGSRAHLADRLALRLYYFRGFVTSTAFDVRDSPTIFGHPAAARAIATSAYVYDSDPTTPQLTPALEAGSSVGPVRIAFDAADRRLATPQTRKKPDLAAPDRVDTTFFPETPAPPCPPRDLDWECNDKPNFGGTSAAAPHVAGVAALLLQQAGGPRSLTPAQVKSILQTTTPPRLVPYGTSTSRVWSIHDGFGLINVMNALLRVPRP